MVIAINLLYLIPGHVGGTETYARQLVRELAKTDRLILFCGQEAATTFAPSKNIQIVPLPLKSSNRFLRIIMEQTLLPWLCFTYKVDVIFSLGYSAPFLHHVPSVVTIHDLNWYYHPEDFTVLSRIIWAVLTRLSARFSDHVITDSQASADSLVDVLNLEKSKVMPILHGTPDQVAFDHNQISSPYVLTVVAGYPHKNLRTLLHAFATISLSYPDLVLVVCGLGGRADKANLDLIKSLDLESKAIVMGYVTREELAGLYAGAKVFVFPSAYEGFGYPVIEAMSYGTPVVSSSAYSLSQVVGDGGILVSPQDPKAYVTAITSILQDPSLSEELIRKGKKRTLELQWSKTGSETLKILHRLGVKK